jgi:hypothetical protein
MGMVAACYPMTVCTDNRPAYATSGVIGYPTRWYSAIHLWCFQAALVRSGSERHLQRSVSPGISPAADLPASSAWGTQSTNPTANGSQHAERDHGPVVTTRAPAVQQLDRRASADTANCVPQLDRMGSSDQAHSSVPGTLLPVAQAAADHRDAAGTRRLEVRMVPATKEVWQTLCCLQWTGLCIVASGPPCLGRHSDAVTTLC